MSDNFSTASNTGLSSHCRGSWLPMAGLAARESRDAGHGNRRLNFIDRPFAEADIARPARYHRTGQRLHGLQGSQGRPATSAPRNWPCSGRRWASRQASISTR
jgi:hypothetical protein